jgi:putative DNA primase/helicase
LAPVALKLDRGGYQVWSGDCLPDHNAPGQSYAGRIAIMLHRDFDTAAQIVPISDVFLCKVTGQTLGETNRALSPLHKGWDVAEAVAQGWGVTEINRLVTLTLGGSLP